MSKKYLAIVLIILFALTFTSGCVQQQQTSEKQNTTQPAQTEQINENDNLEPALQELDELEGL